MKEKEKNKEKEEDTEKGEEAEAEQQQKQLDYKEEIHQHSLLSGSLHIAWSCKGLCFHFVVMATNKKTADHHEGWPIILLKGPDQGQEVYANQRMREIT